MWLCQLRHSNPYGSCTTFVGPFATSREKLRQPYIVWYYESFPLFRQKKRFYKKYPLLVIHPVYINNI